MLRLRLLVGFPVLWLLATWRQGRRLLHGEVRALVLWLSHDVGHVVGVGLLHVHGVVEARLQVAALVLRVMRSLGSILLVSFRHPLAIGLDLRVVQEHALLLGNRLQHLRDAVGQVPLMLERAVDHVGLVFLLLEEALAALGGLVAECLLTWALGWLDVLAAVRVLGLDGALDRGELLKRCLDVVVINDPIELLPLSL